ncbi:MAG: hypothetical protein EBE86_007340 [Hormoscilla sp. GUM202]|nr:hypothetical protein [Hormoscilla sp. GUM202]
MDTQQWSGLISAVVEAALNQTQPVLNQLLKIVMYDIPLQQPEELRAPTAKHILIEIGKGMTQALGSLTHPTLAWFVVHVGVGATPAEAVQSVQMLLEQGFVPFADFFTDRQGIHFYDDGATQEKLQKMPERLSEFTQMTVTINIKEVHHIMEKYKVSEPLARKMLMNLKILEQKMNVSLKELLSELDRNQELLQDVMNSDLSGSIDTN